MPKKNAKAQKSNELDGAEFFAAINLIEKEKGIPKAYMLEKITQALVSAYKRDHEGAGDNVTVEADEEAGTVRMFVKKDVVEEVDNLCTEMSLQMAREKLPHAQLGDVIRIEVRTRDFGRIAAQTARQVIIQGMREAERGMIYDEFSSKEHEILTGVVTRVDPRSGAVSLRIGSGSEATEAFLAPGEQVKGEAYLEGMRLRVYVVEVRRSTKGPQVLISRTHPGLVKRLFEMEVPEIYDGTVEIKSVAREPGARSKVAVFSREANLDPVGACVGPKGSRVRMVVEELRNERVDVIQWSPDPAVYVANALSPAKVSHVSIDEDNNYATVIVPDDQLSLAIGKEGQNARLAARLTGWHIDIKPQSFQGASLVDVEMDDEVEEDDGFCIFVDEDGNRCRNHARPNSQYCGVHADAEAEA